MTHYCKVLPVEYLKPSYYLKQLPQKLEIWILQSIKISFEKQTHLHQTGQNQRTCCLARCFALALLNKEKGVGV